MVAPVVYVVVQAYGGRGTPILTSGFEPLARVALYPRLDNYVVERRFFLAKNPTADSFRIS